MESISKEKLTELLAYDNHHMNEARAQVVISEMTEGLNLPKVAQADFSMLMMKLYGTSKEIAGELVHIGRILIVKIYDFIKENPQMTVGAIIGAIIGWCVSFIPIVGGILQILTTFCGVAVGAYLDKKDNGGEKLDSSLEKLISGSTEAFKKFYLLIKEIFQALACKK